MPNSTLLDLRVPRHCLLQTYLRWMPKSTEQTEGPVPGEGPGRLFPSTKAPGFPPIPHFPWVLGGKSFEKESNHLSLCIIACSRDISSLDSTCSLHADPRSSLLWQRLLGLPSSGSQLQGADRGCLFPLCTVTFLCPLDVLSACLLPG